MLLQEHQLLQQAALQAHFGSYRFFDHLHRHMTCRSYLRDHETAPYTIYEDANPCRSFEDSITS